MKPIHSAFFQPSQNLTKKNSNSFYVLDRDCFIFEEKEIVLFELPEQNSSPVFFKFNDTPIVECYKITNRISNSDCFNFQYYTSFRKEDLFSDHFIESTFHVDPNLFLQKLKLFDVI